MPVKSDEKDLILEKRVKQLENNNILIIIAIEKTQEQIRIIKKYI